MLTGIRRLELADVELPEPGPSDAVVEVRACAICATNLHGWADPARRSPGSALPGTLGHEVAGVVTATGQDVRELAPGDRVCLEPALACACGRCPACRSGDALGCRDGSPLSVWGFAEAMVVPERGLVSVPDGLDLEVAALAEPLASALHGIRHSWTAARSSGRIDGVHVAVLGAGPIGLFALAAARCLGAGEVTVLARQDHQARAAAALGADRVLDGDAPDAAQALRRLRPELAIEAAGARATLETAFASVARGGEVIVLGLFDGPQALDVTSAVLRNLRAFFAVAYGTLGGVSDFSLALQMLSEPDTALARIITHRFRLEDVDEAFNTAATRHSGAQRVVVRSP